ncbi:MAG: polysaccharide export protein [Kiritimatiellae bacterium]|nr:polysaccharide export protein [Kiritimatiellia bacterium]
MIKSGIQLLIGLVTALALAACAHTKPDEAATAQPNVVATTATNAVVLGPGDELTINVWRNSELTSVAKVDADGTIQMPLAGEFHAGGMTLSELQGAITTRLAKYIVNPRVHVGLTAMRSRKFNVLGEVRTPGSFVMDQTIQPFDAVAKAGGFTVDANHRQVLLIHPEGGTNRMTTINMETELGGQPPPVLPMLQNGDIVYVLPRKIANVERFMTRFANILAPFVDAVSLVVLTQGAVDIVKGTNR